MTIEKKDRQSARRAIRLLWVLQGHVLDGLRLKAIAEAMKTNMVNALRDLEMLADEGVAERIPGKEDHWRLTPKLVQVARATAEEFARHRAKVDEFDQRYSRDPR